MKPLVYRKVKRVRHKPPVRVRLHVAKGDLVQVISGDEKGKRGTVLRVFPKTGRIAVDGLESRQAAPQGDADHRSGNRDVPGADGAFQGDADRSQVERTDPRSAGRRTPTGWSSGSRCGPVCAIPRKR